MGVPSATLQPTTFSTDQGGGIQSPTQDGKALFKHFGSNILLRRRRNSDQQWPF
jgi:hypothetical protein